MIGGMANSTAVPMIRLIGVVYWPKKDARPFVAVQFALETANVLANR